MEVWRSVDGSEIAVTAATWELNPKVTFESLANEFKKNPLLAWRNYGSVVESALESPWRDPGILVANRNIDRKSPWDEDRQKFFEWFQPVRRASYFAHFDLSKNRDRTGVAIVHRDLATKRMVVDLMLAIEAEPGKEINYKRLRRTFVLDLVDRGFLFGCVSFDGFQSAESRQALEESGIHTDYCSADRSKEPYDNLIEQVNTGVLDYYGYGFFLQEFGEIRLVNGVKYDHPAYFKNGKKGSKDVSDAVACSSFMAVQAELENPRPKAGRIRVKPRPQPVYERSVF